MSLVTLIQTTPPDQPGSMTAYARLVQQAVQSIGGHHIQLRVCPLYDPDGGASMWHHHLWRLRNARRILNQHDSDLYHVLDGSMAGFIPRSFLTRTVITVHDLIPVFMARGEWPGNTPSLPARWIIRRSVSALVRCRSVCVVSNHTHGDVKRISGRSDAAVIPHAVRTLTPKTENKSARLPGKFILHVGNNAGYKNRMGVLEVFSRLQDMEQLHVMMVGPPPSKDLRDRAAKLKRVEFVDHVDDGLLAQLYRHAAVFLFPSRYEGFGMPVLEAMAAGCPVVCSTSASLPEVAGDAALTASFGQVEQLALYCRQLIEDPEFRRQMSEKGLVRASDFTLNRMGHMLVDWYGRSLPA